MATRRRKPEPGDRSERSEQEKVERLKRASDLERCELYTEKINSLGAKLHRDRRKMLDAFLDSAMCEYGFECERCGTATHLGLESPKDGTRSTCSGCGHSRRRRSILQDDVGGYAEVFRCIHCKEWFSHDGWKDHVVDCFGRRMLQYYWSEEALHRAWRRLIKKRRGE